MNDRLERTQLYDWHKEHGDVILFAGWEMPVRYTTIREEHMAVRDSCGAFDASHRIDLFLFYFFEHRAYCSATNRY